MLVPLVTRDDEACAEGKSSSTLIGEDDAVVNLGLIEFIDELIGSRSRGVEVASAVSSLVTGLVPTVPFV